MGTFFFIVGCVAAVAVAAYLLWDSNNQRRLAEERAEAAQRALDEANRRVPTPLPTPAPVPPAADPAPPPVADPVPNPGSLYTQAAAAPSPAPRWAGWGYQSNYPSSHQYGLPRDYTQAVDYQGERYYRYGDGTVRNGLGHTVRDLAIGAAVGALFDEGIRAATHHSPAPTPDLDHERERYYGRNDDYTPTTGEVAAVEGERPAVINDPGRSVSDLYQDTYRNVSFEDAPSTAPTPQVDFVDERESNRGSTEAPSPSGVTYEDDNPPAPNTTYQDDRSAGGVSYTDDTSSASSVTYDSGTDYGGGGVSYDNGDGT